MIFSFAHVLKKLYDPFQEGMSRIQPPSEAQTQLPVPVVTEKHSAPYSSAVDAPRTKEPPGHSPGV